MKSCVLALLIMVIAAPASASVDWTVVSSNEGSVRVVVAVDGAVMEPLSDGLSLVRVPGAHLTGEPGLPSLPADARWVALPAEGAVSVRVLRVRVEELGVGRLKPGSSPEVMPGSEGQPRLVEHLRFADGYDAFSVGEGDVVSIGIPVRQRRHRMVSVGVRPVLYDASTGRARIVREVEFELTWPRTLGADPVPSAADATVLRSVLNPDQAREWASLSPRHRAVLDAARLPAAQREQDAAGIGVLDPVALAADGIRMRVEHTGIVRVTISDLADGGGLPIDVPRSWLRVVQMRSSEPGSEEYPLPLVVDVPIHFFGAPDEAANLSTADEIYFHALRVEDDADTLVAGGNRALPALPWGESRTNDLVAPRYAGDHFNGENVYWAYLMAPPVDGWARMEEELLSPSTGSPAASYFRRDHFEGNLGYRDDPYDPWVERFAWNRRNELDVVRSLSLVNPVPGQALTVKFAAGGHITGADDLTTDFSIRQGVTEQPLLSRVMTSVGVMNNWTSVVQGSPFVDGVLEFRMRRLFNGSEVWVNTFLDHVVLEYEANFRASGDVLRFTTGSTAASVDVEVEGYSREDLLCFDVTDPRRPRWINLAASNVEDRSGGGAANYALSLQVPQPAGERTLAAAPRVRFKRIGRASVEPDAVADIFDEVNDLQVLAIGPESFRMQAERWIGWREQVYADAGWNFGYVDVQQIYDQFSGGLQSPWAIKQFVEWAWLNWNAVAVVLMGDANEDAFDAGGQAGPNHVPPSLHLQSFTGNRELLASDKWYGLFGYTPQGSSQYPTGLAVTSDLVVGRFAVADEQGLSTLIDKIMAYEQADPNEAWRRRTLWIADDAYSNDLIGAGAGCYRFQPIELDFVASQQASTAVVAGALDQTIGADLLDADEYTRDCRVGDACESLSGVRACYDRNHRAEFIDRWSQGWLWLSYQGHANYNVLGHENLLLADGLSQLRNDGRPFVFFGMGCHVSDFLRPEEGVTGASLGELLLRMPRAGAIATYGSSGFEFLTPNATFMEILSETMFDHRVPGSPVFGAGLRNQWILGDVMARGELETLALRSSLGIFKGDEMVAQYNLIGDPLLRMDAGAPRMDLARGGQPLPGGSDVVADVGVPYAAIDAVLVDESGLDRLEITDSEGRDYSSVVPALVGSDPRQEDVTVELPVYPQAYTVEVATFDAARDDLRQTVLALNVPMPLDLLVDGELTPPGSNLEFEAGTPRTIEVAFTSPVDLVPGDFLIDFPGVDVSTPTVTGSARDWTVVFNATARSGVEPGILSLVLQGIPTELLGSGEDPTTTPPAVLRHAVFPNPVANVGHLVVHVEGTVERARFSVYDLAGNEVSSRDLVIGATAPDPGSGTRIAFEFEARDRRGDELANGTYFYRVSVEGPAGSARSDMGRLLVMR